MGGPITKSQTGDRGHAVVVSMPLEVIEGDCARVSLESRSVGDPVVSAVAAFVLRTLQPYAPSGQTVTPTTDITADLHIDSLTVMNAVLDIEDHFDISIPLNRLAQFRTVEDLAAYIVSRLGKH
jgi:acyl carrier protein